MDFSFNNGILYTSGWNFINSWDFETGNMINKFENNNLTKAIKVSNNWY